MFGMVYQAEDQIIQPLESQGCRRLYPLNYDHKRELRKLNHSVLFNFLELLDILITAPDSQKRNEKLDDLSLLFVHMFHLINEFRPNQARETLRAMLEKQLTQRVDIAGRFDEQLQRVRAMLFSAAAALPDDDASILRTIARDTVTEDGAGPIDAVVKSDDAGEEYRRLDKAMCDIVDTL